MMKQKMFKLIKFLFPIIFIGSLVLDYYYNSEFDPSFYSFVIVITIVLILFLGLVITEILHLTGRFKKLKHGHTIWLLLIIASLRYSYEVLPKAYNNYLYTIDYNATEKLTIQDITGEYTSKNNKLIIHNNTLHIITDSLIINGEFEQRISDNNVLDFHISKQTKVFFPSYFSMYFLKLNNGQTRLRFTHHGVIDNFIESLILKDWIQEKNIQSTSTQSNKVDFEDFKQELKDETKLNLDVDSLTNNAYKK